MWAFVTFQTSCCESATTSLGGERHLWRVVQSQPYVGLLNWVSSPSSTPNFPALLAFIAEHPGFQTLHSKHPRAIETIAMFNAGGFTWPTTG
ncbi:hypothetical protein GOP47_0027216 [Adiantum capillus-veneris]|nr:hypothetical protein GOP47_0027216 [Adiantum capillus-veneris]